jgi:hypothetical protein
MAVSSKKQRQILRTAHLVAFAILATYLYSPLSSNAVFSVMVRVMVVPMLMVTGLLMWQLPRLRRWMRGRRQPARSTASVSG